MGFSVKVGVESGGVVGVVEGLDVAVGGCVGADVGVEVVEVERVVGWGVAVGVGVG